MSTKTTLYRGDKVYAKDLVAGVIYKSTPAGEFQVDPNTNKVYFKSAWDGSIQEVKPHPNALFTVWSFVDEWRN